MRSFGKNCLKEMPRQGNAVAAHGMSLAVRRACRSNDTRSQLVSELSCFNAVAPAMRQELEGFRVDLVRASRLSDSPGKMRAACCSYFTHTEAILAIGTRSGCGSRRIRYLDAFMKSFANDVLDLICSEPASPSSSSSSASKRCSSSILRNLPPLSSVRPAVPFVDSYLPALLLLLSTM